MHKKGNVWLVAFVAIVAVVALVSVSSDDSVTGYGMFGAMKKAIAKQQAVARTGPTQVQSTRAALTSGQCYDSDGGVNPFSYGYCNDAQGYFGDRARESDHVLIENYCKNNRCSFILLECGALGMGQRSLKNGFCESSPNAKCSDDDGNDPTKVGVGRMKVPSTNHEVEYYDYCSYGIYYEYYCNHGEIWLENGECSCRNANNQNINNRDYACDPSKPTRRISNRQITAWYAPRVGSVVQQQGQPGTATASQPQSTDYYSSSATAAAR